ncbi:DsbA family oxidoreductase [Acidimangrovimonas pyrenivorans]|uniref:DsbA family protein n=1 Tax=Acidimangrovimonas pyrenivorans TaxID=2030798 RepID=A0ABV7AK61_9RHOB
MMAVTVDFFHDVVCGWCFNISPRLRLLAAEFALDIRHHCFVLQDSPAQMAAVFGSLPRSKQVILAHWAACRDASERPEAFNIDAMRDAPFDYPHGLPGALACKAAERLEGQDGHWRMFDAVQRAHITAARNVADPELLVELAAEAGFDRVAFRTAQADPATRALVEADRRLARQLQVSSVPTVILRDSGHRLVNAPLAELRAQLTAALPELRAS